MLARMMQTKTAETVTPEIATLEILSPGCGMLILVGSLDVLLTGEIATGSLNVLLTEEIATICANGGTELVLFFDHITGEMEKLLCS